MSRHEKMQDILPSLGRILRRFWPYIRRERTLVAGSFLALFAEIGFRILEPWPLKFVFDRVIQTAPAGGKSGVPLVDNLDPMTLLTLAALAAVVIAGLRALSSYGNTVGFALVGNRVLTNVRGELFRHLQRLSLSYHAKKKSGDLIIRVIGDVGLLKEVTVTAFLPLMASVLLLVGMVGVMFWLNWKLLMFALPVFPLFWLTALRLGRRIRQTSQKQRRREGAMAANAAQSIEGIKIIQALSLESVFDESFSRENQSSLKEGVQAKRLAANLERTVDVLIAVATALVLLYGARLVMRNALTPGDLLVFLSYLKSSFRPVRNFAKYTARLAKASASGDRVLEVLETEPIVRDVPGAVPAPPFRGGIRFDGVSFGYGEGGNVLEGIDFEARAGERIALVGPSGAGKSTLVGLIMRLYDPGEGRVLVDGRDIRTCTLASYRPQISMVLQDSMLFGATVHDNIAYGSPGITRDGVEAAARLANAHDFIAALPEGYDTELGERGATLSNGQRQRIAIARAAVRKSPILILDEPTTGLDNESESAVLDALERLSLGKTTFLIVHDMKHAASSDQILFIERGRIRESGGHEDLMQANGRYAAMVRLEAAERDRGPRKGALHAIGR